MNSELSQVGPLDYDSLGCSMRLPRPSHHKLEVAAAGLHFRHQRRGGRSEKGFEHMFKESNVGPVDGRNGQRRAEEREKM